MTNGIAKGREPCRSVKEVKFASITKRSAPTALLVIPGGAQLDSRRARDQAYRGQRAVIRQHAPKAQDFTNLRYRHRAVVGEIERAKNRTKSKIRARVEHAIGVIKRVFGFAALPHHSRNWSSWLSAP